MGILRLAALAAAAMLSIAAGQPPHGDWTMTVRVTPSGSHVLGNPDAPIKLAEYVSYTCPHCAHFTQEADTPLRLYYVTPGKVSIEVRHLVRDPIDLTVAMLTNCGDPAKFFLNHTTFLWGQSRWIAAANTASAAQQSRWNNGTQLSRRRAIANDFGFYAIMEGRGYDRPAADRCLADDAMAHKLAEQTSEAMKLGVDGTPNFLINGDLLAATYDWQTLQPQLKARM